MPLEIEKAVSYLPTLEELGFLDYNVKDERSCIEFKGGEEEGLKRV